MSDKWKRRDKKQQKRKNGMRVSGRSLLTVISTVRKKKSEIAAVEIKKQSQT